MQASERRAADVYLQDARALLTRYPRASVAAHFHHIASDMAVFASDAAQTSDGAVLLALARIVRQLAYHVALGEVECSQESTNAKPRGEA